MERWGLLKVPTEPSDLPNRLYKPEEFAALRDDQLDEEIRFVRGKREEATSTADLLLKALRELYDERARRRALRKAQKEEPVCGALPPKRDSRDRPQDHPCEKRGRHSIHRNGPRTWSDDELASL